MEGGVEDAEAASNILHSAVSILLACTSVDGDEEVTSLVVEASHVMTSYLRKLLLTKEACEGGGSEPIPTPSSVKSSSGGATASSSSSSSRLLRKGLEAWLRLLDAFPGR